MCYSRFRLGGPLPSGLILHLVQLPVRLVSCEWASHNIVRLIGCSDARRLPRLVRERRRYSSSRTEVIPIKHLGTGRPPRLPLLKERIRP